VVRLEGVQRRDGNGDALRGSGCPGREDLQQRVLDPALGGGEAGVLGIEQDRQIPLTLIGRLVGSGDDDLEAKILSEIIDGQLVALAGVDDDDASAAALEPHLDGRRREGGEQRYVHGADSPQAQENRHQVGALSHQRRHPVPGPDTQRGESGGGLFRPALQPPVRKVPGLKVGIDDRERHTFARVPVAEQLCGDDTPGELRRERQSVAGDL